MTDRARLPLVEPGGMDGTAEDVFDPGPFSPDERSVKLTAPPRTVTTDGGRSP
jgi:hypothetical protein